jgi:hypothetical protein
MLCGEGTLGIDDIREGVRDAIDVVGEGDVRNTLGLHAREFVIEVDPRYVAQQSRITRREQFVDDGRVVSRARARAEHRQRGLVSLARSEYVDGRARGNDAARERDRRFLPPIREAEPVPVLVDAEDALSDRIVEPGAARDVSSALAAQLLDAVSVGSATRE